MPSRRKPSPLHLIYLELQELNRILRLKYNVYDKNTEVMKVPEGSMPAPEDLSGLPVIHFIPKGERISSEVPTIGHNL